jgi:cobalt-zinc-cadmium efflux system membrane fusion protein
MTARNVGICALVVVVAGFTACFTAATPPDAQLPETGAELDAVVMSREQIAHAGIGWRAVDGTDATDTVEVPGELAPNEDRTARLGSPARARVLAVHVHLGDRVARDQPLVALASEQAATARAEYTKAMAELSAHRVAARYARAALGRAERLLALKAISRQDVEKAQVDEEEAESMQAQAEAEVERARATLAQLGVSKSGEMIVRAPLAGVVLTRDAVPGSVVDAGDPLLMITDPSTLWLDIAATERVAAVLKAGGRVTFTVAELRPQIFEAVIGNVGGALDPATRTLPVHAVVVNSSGVLRPAMFATVVLPLGDARSGVSVPESALQLLEQRPVIFVAVPDADGGARFERRDVEVGGRAHDTVHIVRGLRPGEIVVVDGAFAVKAAFARARTST